MSLETIRTVAVLGAGTMGNGIAHVFARSGYKVILRDVEQRYLDRARDDDFEKPRPRDQEGQLAEAEKPGVLRKDAADHRHGALARADFAVEAVPERLDLKLRGAA